MIFKRKTPIVLSISEAARFLGDINKRSNIKNCAKGKTKTAYGYNWRYP